MPAKSLPAFDPPYGAAATPRSNAGTSGKTRGTNGWGRAYAVTAALLTLACAVNIASHWHDARPGAPLWRPVLGEVTSICAALGSAWIAFAARDWTDGRRLGPVRALGPQAAACGAFSACHCLGMWTLRRIALTAAGLAYGWSVPLGQLAYEFRKDVVTYTVIALIYQGARAGRAANAGRAADAGAAPPPVPANAYTIRDGAKLWRVQTQDILAVTAAANYVEFLMADGARMLARATLAGVAAELGEAGFVRVHRSWIVNTARVRALAPDNSGDYTLTLEGGAAVPLSRRFPAALMRLRG